MESSINCFQEALAAQYICAMKNEEFDKELKTFLSHRVGTIVRLFTCGILFNKEIATKKYGQERNDEGGILINYHWSRLL